MSASVHQLRPNAMPSENGFVNVWRDIQGQDWYRKPEHLAIFMHILLNASHKARQADWKGRKVSILPGQFLTTYSKLAETFGIDSIQKVRRIIKNFVELGQISKLSIKTAGQDIGLVLTLRNWEKWQKTPKNCDTPSDTPSDTPKATPIKASTGSSDTPSDTPSDTLNNNVYNNNILVPKGTCENSDEFARKKPPVPNQEIIKLFGEILPSLPQPKKLTPARTKAIRARHINDLKSDLCNWRKYFEYIRDNCSWMTSGNYNVDFDYVIRQSTFVKVLEGAKNDR